MAQIRTETKHNGTQREKRLQPKYCLSSLKKILIDISFVNFSGLYRGQILLSSIGMDSIILFRVYFRHMF